MHQVILLLEPQNLASRGRRPSILSPRSFLFVPIALETLGAIAAESLEFLSEVGRRVPLIVITSTLRMQTSTEVDPVRMWIGSASSQDRYLDEFQSLMGTSLSKNRSLVKLLQ